MSEEIDRNLLHAVAQLVLRQDMLIDTGSITAEDVRSPLPSRKSWSRKNDWNGMRLLPNQFTVLFLDSSIQDAISEGLRI